MRMAMQRTSKCIAGCAVCLVFLAIATEVFAAEASTGWRGTYDLVMRWLNFAILVALFFKYARRPLMAFLNGKSKQIETDIKRVEEEKKLIHARVDELLKAREKGHQQLNDIKKRIISKGELKKEQIIEDARQEGRLLLENAQKKIAHDIMFARQKLKAEMLDQAIDIAAEKLPGQITEQDLEHSLHAYYQGIQSLTRP